jgi:predicted transcriptional regulator
VTDDAVAEQIRILRRQGHSPKQIARTLGMAQPAVVTALREVMHADYTSPDRGLTHIAAENNVKDLTVDHACDQG